jgi:hypothetical protein
MDGLPKCRWFTRGWTLQELLAPSALQFFNLNCDYIGNRCEFSEIISDFTKIPSRTLLQKRPLSASSVAAKMSWAAHRTTKRTEDMAYCLLGIFDVNMPLIYGEGTKAFRRLQEEVIKRDNDLTIFAWDSMEAQNDFVGVFAPSPAVFVGSSNMLSHGSTTAEFSVTNKGLLLTGDFVLGSTPEPTAGITLTAPYVLLLGIGTNGRCGIYLRKLGPRLFCRVGSLPLAVFDLDHSFFFDITSAYILLDPQVLSVSSYAFYWDLAFCIPQQDGFQLEHVTPTALWEPTSRCILQPFSYGTRTMVLALRVRFTVNPSSDAFALVVLLDNRPGQTVPLRGMFINKDYPRMTHIIFQQSHMVEGMSWGDLEFHAPELQSLTRSVVVKSRDGTFNIKLHTEDSTMEVLSTNVTVKNLVFSIERPE